MKRVYDGFTLIELLITISIVAVLSVIAITTYQGIQSRTHDSIRKQDLDKLAMALEIYFQKNGKYIPPNSGTLNCTRDRGVFYTNIQSYMSNNIVPRDPKTQYTYCYISYNNGKSFRLYATLENCQASGGNLCASSSNNYTVTSPDLTPVAAPIGSTMRVF